MSNLTIKQENFVIEYLKDGNATRAYKCAYNAEKMKESSIWTNASKLLSDTKVSQRVAELREQQVSKAIMTIDQRKELLTKFAYEEDPSSAMKAVDLLNKMDGVYITKNEITEAPKVKIEVVIEE